MGKDQFLFNDSDMKDTGATALSHNDTFIQRQSKRFAKQTILDGEARDLMIAYQAGAKNMQIPVLEALCKDCPSKYECGEHPELGECESYNRIWTLFNK